MNQILLNDRAYDVAAAVAAQITNTLAKSDICKAELFGRILFLVLAGIHEVTAERIQPSRN
jgi:hypothetical protein